MFKDKDALIMYLHEAQHYFPSSNLKEMVVDDKTYEELFELSPIHMYYLTPSFQGPVGPTYIYSNYQWQVRLEARRMQPREET